MGEGLVHNTDGLEDAESLIVEMRGAREGVGRRSLLEHHDVQTVPSKQVCQQRPDRAAADNGDVICGFGFQFER